MPEAPWLTTSAPCPALFRVVSMRGLLLRRTTSLESEVLQVLSLGCTFSTVDRCFVSTSYMGGTSQVALIRVQADEQRSIPASWACWNDPEMDPTRLDSALCEPVPADDAVDSLSSQCNAIFRIQPR